MSAIPAISPLFYPDNSVLGRLSDPDPALATEAELVRRIIIACRGGRLRLLNSVVLEAEVDNGPAYARRESHDALTLAVATVPLGEILRVARRLNRLRLPATDTLHLAAAVAGGARYAVSCDRHWLGQAAEVAALLGPEPAVVSPGELLRREGL